MTHQPQTGSTLCDQHNGVTVAYPLHSCVLVAVFNDDASTRAKLNAAAAIAGKYIVRCNQMVDQNLSPIDSLPYKKLKALAAAICFLCRSNPSVMPNNRTPTVSYFMELWAMLLAQKQKAGKGLGWYHTHTTLIAGHQCKILYQPMVYNQNDRLTVSVQNGEGGQSTLSRDLARQTILNNGGLSVTVEQLGAELVAQMPISQLHLQAPNHPDAVSAAH